jgi:beta-alanine--pyruvate transaminase
MPANAFASTNSPLTREAMEPFWLPMTPNRQFKSKPRIFVAAEGMHYVADDGRWPPQPMP